MNTFDTVSRELQKFGLSENQIRVYFALVKHGELRVQELVNIAHIPRTSVYEGVEGLLKVGLVEKIVDHKFVRIKPYPIGNLRNNLDEKLLAVQQLMIDLDSLEKVLSLSNAQTPQSTVVRYYKGISGGRQLFYNSLSAKSEVYVYSSYGRSQFVGKKFYMNFAREAKEKGIREVLINPTDYAINLIRRDTGTALARTSPKDIRFLPEKSLVIKGETLIYDNVFAQIDLKAEEINGFEIESTGFAKMQRSIFETLWETAQPLSVLIS